MQRQLWQRTEMKQSVQDHNFNAICRNNSKIGFAKVYTTAVSTHNSLPDQVLLLCTTGTELSLNRSLSLPMIKKAASYRLKQPVYVSLVTNIPGPCIPSSWPTISSFQMSPFPFPVGPRTAWRSNFLFQILLSGNR
jgi:hypothetical protein